MKEWRRRVGRSVTLVILVTLAGCYPNNTMQKKPMRPKRDINAVLRDHDQDLLKLAGVVGVYVGSVGNTNQLCLKVMLARDLPETRRAIPKFIEGYRVISEVTGEIHPMRHP